MIRLCVSELYRDSSVALFDDETLLFAVGEERLSRQKLQGGFPRLSVEACLRAAGVTLDEVHSLCLARPARRDEWPAIIRRTWSYSSFHRTTPPLVSAIDCVLLRGYTLPRLLVTLHSLNREVETWLDTKRFDRTKVSTQYDHHFLHAVSAYYGSGFEDALAVTADGQGNGLTATVWACRSGVLSPLHVVHLPHSLGTFYAAATKALGFRPDAEEGKITGLAACEPPAEEVLAFCRAWAQASGPTFMVRQTYGRYPQLLRLARRYSRSQIAAAFQTVLEEVVLDFVRHHLQQSGLSRVVVAGGVFANVKLNQRIKDQPGVEELYVFPAMADVGLCWGLGMWEARRGKPFVPTGTAGVYWGFEYSEQEIARVLQEAAIPFERVENVARVVGDLLADGAVVHRFDGRMEFGPRALGNRSILSAATDPAAVGRLNDALGRDDFMPFAPVTLAEAASRCYRTVDPGRRAAAYMTVAFACTHEMRARCPAAVHVDGSARPQLIDRATNSTYYDILHRYYERTGIPSIINTSFNMHDEPIVCSPADALSAYQRSQIGVLSIGPFIVRQFTRASAEVRH